MHSTLGMLLMLLSQEPGPAEVVTMFYDAVASRDGRTAISLVAQPMLDQIELLLSLTRDDEGSAAALQALVGMDITFAELDTMTAATFGARLLESAVVQDAVLSNEITCGDSWIEGDTAYVAMVFTGDDVELDTFRLVRVEDSWKLMVELF